MFCCNKSRLLLQFHITGRCNLRCKHCYRTEGDVEPLSYDDVIAVIDRYRELRYEYNRVHHTKRRGHINITGGEPFFRSDIKEILRYLGSCKGEFSYGILSNGSFIDDEIIGILKDTDVSFVQLSIDGKREMHDSLRAKGDYDRVFDKAEYLESNGIRTYISFTANRQNYKGIPAVARECRKRGITKLWSDRLVPIGNGEDIKELAITERELPLYLKSMRRAQGNIITRYLYPKTEVTMNRALQFQGSDGAFYTCGAGKTLITVDEFGNIMPCRRMPIIAGNVLKEYLKDVYFNNDVFKDLRSMGIPFECKDCIYAYRCRGGAKCQSYAVHGDYRRADPGCPCINLLK